MLFIPRGTSWSIAVVDSSLEVGFAATFRRRASP
jgi:hypothetical protein